ncbi:hypothetical protein [Mesorhizobium australicum]|uniref:hypothetical protein n=1 Tax=Mesorhizobium australicum TaxID=536018 RepID=UPI003339E661
MEPDQIAIAIAALDEIAEETRSLEEQWALRRERARYDAERARRQHDTVEPEDRLVARTLEKAWEDKLRLVDEIEQEYRRWKDREPLVLQAQDHAALQGLAAEILLRNLPLEHDAVGSVLCHGHSSSESPAARSTPHLGEISPGIDSLEGFEDIRNMYASGLRSAGVIFHGMRGQTQSRCMWRVMSRNFNGSNHIRRFSPNNVIA